MQTPKPRDYKHADYPSVRYHPERPPITIASADDEPGEGWYMHPACQEGQEAPESSAAPPPKATKETTKETTKAPDKETEKPEIPKKPLTLKKKED
jgi:hypothetical protein